MGGIPALPLPGPPPLCLCLSLTSPLAVPGHSLGHEAPGLVQAHRWRSPAGTAWSWRASADRASLPAISHLGVKLLSVGWGAPSTLPVSPCGKPAAPTSASSAAAAPGSGGLGPLGVGWGGIRRLGFCAG